MSPASPLWAKVVDFVERFDAVQIRYGGAEFRRLVEIIARSVQSASTVSSSEYARTRGASPADDWFSLELSSTLFAPPFFALTPPAPVSPPVTSYSYAGVLKAGNIMQRCRYSIKTYSICRHLQIPSWCKSTPRFHALLMSSAPRLSLQYHISRNL